MAVQIAPFQRNQRQVTSVQKNPMSDLLTLGGAAIGGVFGGAPGAATGASLGSTLGGVVAPPTSSTRNVDVQPQAGPVATGSDALGRRLGELQQGSRNLEQISQSIDSLKYVQDDDLKYKLAQPLVQAAFQAQKEA